ncbi:LysR family transcriptional regulator [Methylobacterium variabile]|jgi:DNA-binding transcriptional LysR family regulator|uniref:LysR family transcriptional regulator n=1 Tax=Methylobacterium variabile TaxID=298794 RepID=A0A0J6RWY3_9HYPH|nr:LysR family transcriptional regulator [Methylobacterium variabile]KMO27365.1 LysR family transcriptional regulator [Methylobacterium variabile]
MDLAIALRAFVRTVERGSVTLAARDLGVSQPAVTKHLRNLEQHSGTRLLERSPRIVRPTPQGQALYEASRAALTAIDAALEGIRQDGGTVEGLLRLHAPSCIGSRHLITIVMEFQAIHPAVTVDLVLEDRAVDLVYDGFDLALSYGHPVNQDVILRRIGLIRRILAAAPDLLARTGPFETLEALSRAPLVTTLSPRSRRDKLVLERDGETVEIPVNPTMRTNDAKVATRVLLAGQAAGAVQQNLVAEELADGRLVRILPDYEVKPTEAFLTYPSARLLRPAVRAFIDFVLPALRALPGVTA